MPPDALEAGAGAVVSPFTVSVPEAELDDLRARLRATRWPEALPGTGWDDGTEVDLLRDLCRYWGDARPRLGDRAARPDRRPDREREDPDGP